MKRVTNFTDKTGSRPILSCVNFNSDGSIIATNSHILIKLSDYHTNKNSFCFNPQTLEQYDQNYPNINNLISNDSLDNFKISYNEYSQILHFIKSTPKKEIVKLSVEKNILSLTNSLTSFNIDLPSISNKIEIHLDVKLFKIVMEAIVDLTSEINVNFNGSNKALIFNNENLTILLQPMRIS